MPGVPVVLGGHGELLRSSMTLSLPDSFFRNATNPMWVFDEKSLRFLDVNEAACRRYGYSKEEFLTMSLLDIRSLEQQKLFKDRANHSGGRIWEHLTKSGEALYIQGYEFPFDVDGRKVILAMIAEHTERVKLERERAGLLQRYQILSEAANDLLWDWDLQTDQVTHSEALITQYGYDRSDLQQPITWWSDKIHPEDFNIASWSIQEAIRERRKYWTAEYRLKKADGSYVLVLDRGILHSDDNEKPVRMVGSIVDLTTRKAAEDDRNQLFRLSIDSMLFLDPSGTITQANSAFFNVSGIDISLENRRNMRDFLTEEDRQVFDNAVRKALEEGVEGSFSTTIATEAGKGKSIQWGLITNEARSRLFLVGRDVTESKVARQKLEEALARSQELAIEAQAARKAQTEFLQNMSHELRTPMNGMLGSAQILASRAHNEEERKMASILLRSGESLLQILNDILDFSKIESGKITLDHAPFNLADSVQSVVDVFALSAEQKGLELVNKISTDASFSVIGDQFRLRQILSNLVGNSIKFTDKGSISLSLNVRQLDEGHLDAIIKVTDSGIGIPEEMQPRIFDRFVQVDSSATRRHGGTGLGLSICKTVVELMGGSIELKSTIGIGTEFTLRFPFQIAKEATRQLSSLQRFASSTKPGAKVLIAEDVEVNAMILTSWLKERGFDCVIVPTGSEAIQVLAKEPFDGAFLDLHMPGATGYDVVRELRSSEKGSKKRLPVVAVTASVSHEERQRCIDEGFDDYIPKPIMVADLDRVVARLF